MNVSLYTFAKKKNSTAVPESTPVTYACILKDGCSVMKPTIGLDIGRLTSPTNYNYAAIQDFSRYYYVKDWYWDKGLWWANLSVDVLASYKIGILNSTMYVARASKKFDGQIGDTLFPAKTMYDITDIQYWPNNDKTPWTFSFKLGFYVVGIMNNDASSIGAVSYYVFTPSQFSVFKQRIFTDSTWTGIDITNPDLGDNLYKSLFNPIQYISSVQWFPFTFNTGWGTALTSIHFGWWVIDNINCYRLTTYITAITEFITVPLHPQSVERGVYLISPPYSIYKLFAPPFGEFSLDSTMFTNAEWDPLTDTSRLFIGIKIDFISGQGVLEVSATRSGSANLVTTYAQISVPIQIAQVTADHWGNLRNTVETTANVIGSISSLNVAGAISSAATGVLNAIETAIPHPQAIGSNGSVSIYYQYFKLESLFRIMANDARDDKGRPLCREIPMTELYPGYVMTVGAHISIAGTEEEIASINAELDGGVYLE